MTVTALASALVTDVQRVDVSAWTAWLRHQLDPGWRAGEWDGERLLFTGDLHHPRTAVWKCVTRRAAAR